MAAPEPAEWTASAAGRTRRARQRDSRTWRRARRPGRRLGSPPPASSCGSEPDGLSNMTRAASLLGLVYESESSVTFTHCATVVRCPKSEVSVTGSMRRPSPPRPSHTSAPSRRKIRRASIRRQGRAPGVGDDVVAEATVDLNLRPLTRRRRLVLRCRGRSDRLWHAGKLGDAGTRDSKVGDPAVQRAPADERVDRPALGIADAVGHARGRVLVSRGRGGVTALEPASAGFVSGEPGPVDRLDLERGQRAAPPVDPCGIAGAGRRRRTRRWRPLGRWCVHLPIGRSRRDRRQQRVYGRRVCCHELGRDEWLERAAVPSPVEGVRARRRAFPPGSQTRLPNPLRRDFCFGKTSMPRFTPASARLPSASGSSFGASAPPNACALPAGVGGSKKHQRYQPWPPPERSR